VSRIAGGTPEEAAARQIRLLRTGRGWTQQEVADRMRLYGHAWLQTTVSKTEDGTRPLRLNEIVSLTAVFRIKITDLLADVPGRPCPVCAGYPPAWLTCNICGRSGREPGDEQP
jgi:transcriptional regulator with XRE-family HTH domain